VGAVTAALILMGLGTELRASTVVRMSEAQMIQQADWVGMGQIRGSRTQWINRRLWTMVELQVSDSLKGNLGDSVTLVVPGGTDAERGLSYVVPGVPGLFPKGSRMLVFGQRSELAPNGVEAVGLMQGMFFIENGADGAAVARRELSGVELSGGAPKNAQAASERLATLRERIKAMLQGVVEGESR
jgi:hypothetical protein